MSKFSKRCRNKSVEAIKKIHRHPESHEMLFKLKCSFSIVLHEASSGEQKFLLVFLVLLAITLRACRAWLCIVNIIFVPVGWNQSFCKCWLKSWHWCTVPLITLFSPRRSPCHWRYFLSFPKCLSCLLGPQCLGKGWRAGYHVTLQIDSLCFSHGS